MNQPLKVGAVIYDPKITVIWEMIADFVKEHGNGFEIETIFFENYRQQVKALLNEEIDVAWNSPLANLEAELKTNHSVIYGCMRDSDRDLKTVLVTRKDNAIHSVQDLKGQKITFGAVDSPQARLIPIQYLRENGLEFAKDYEEVRYDLGVGLDGDHVGGEKDALESVQTGENAAGFAIQGNYEAWLKDGSLDKNQLEVIGYTNSFDHCIFTGHPNLNQKHLDEFSNILMKMDYNKEEDKEILDLEGLKEWVPGRTSNYEEIRHAVSYINFFKE